MLRPRGMNVTGVVKRRLVLSVLPLLLGACGAEATAGRSPTMPRDTTTATTTHEGKGEPADARGGQTRVDALTCKGDLREGGTFDYADASGGAATLAQALRDIAQPEEKIDVQLRRKDSAVAWVLRRDDTARMRLHLVTLDDGTWRVENVESCVGQGLH